MKSSQQSCSGRRSVGGFTLVELLVIIGMVGLLVTLLAPALAATKPGNKAVVCMNDKRQLALAWQMYSSDNADLLVSSVNWISQTGNYMDWTSSSKNTNSAALIDPTQSLIAPYVKNLAIFKCPADSIPAARGPRVRSVSMNEFVGDVNNLSQTGYTKFMRMTDFNAPGPSLTWVFLDECPDSINDDTFSVTMNPSPATWTDVPASTHSGSGDLAFADGHAELKKWQDANTQAPVMKVNPCPDNGKLSPNDSVWMQQRTTSKQ